MLVFNIKLSPKGGGSHKLLYDSIPEADAIFFVVVVHINSTHIHILQETNMEVFHVSSS